MVTTVPLTTLYRLLAVLLLSASHLSAQPVGKIALQEKDYTKWAHLTMHSISPDGMWCTYQLSNNNRADTLFLKHIRNGTTFSFATAQSGIFGNSTFTALGSDNILRTVNLKSGEFFRNNGAAKFTYALDKTRIIYENDSRQLIILAEDGKVLKRIDSIYRWEASPKKDKLAFWIKNHDGYTLKITDLKTLEATSIQNEYSYTPGVLVWGNPGSQLLSTCSGSERHELSVLLYDYNTGVKYILDKPAKGIFAEWTLNVAYMHVTVDGQKVNLLFTPPAQADPVKNAAEIWNGRDKRLYPARVTDGPREAYSQLFQWDSKKNTLEKLSGEGFQSMNMSADGKHLLQWDKFAKEPQTKIDADRDIYSLDIASGKATLLADNIEGNDLMLLNSPKGGYVAYFKQGDWHLYSYKTAKTTSLGKGLGLDISKQEDDVHTQLVPRDQLIFSEDERWVLLRDEFDWWTINTITFETKRITNGHISGIRYQIAGPSLQQLPNRYGGTFARIVNLEKPLIFLKTDMKNFSTGYCTIGLDGKERTLAYGPYRYSQIAASEAGTLAFVKEDFNTPQTIEVIEKPYRECRTLFKSNQHEAKYELGSVEMLTYKRNNGKELGSLVYYPPNFNPNSKYPVIVFIYENLSNNIHRHLHPSVSETTGFNIPDLLAQGYIVFLPDTESDLGNPGAANLDCVTNAVKMLISKGSADPDRIGLYGHSHGGFKVLYILTQTGIFKAAVSGAGIANMITDYLSPSVWNGPLYWRYENDQLRMGKELYGNIGSYIDNSAIFHARNITTPLLSWSGKEDYHVMRDQTIQMHLAMRRLGKEHIMLLYPEEGHSLQEAANQKDLRDKLLDWFGFFLKNSPKNTWMLPKE